MEYLLVIGFALLMITPLIIVFYTQSSNYNADVTNNQINKVADEIIKAADTVFYLGKPSQITLTLYLPQDIENIEVQGNRTMVWTYLQGTTQQQIYKTAVGNITSHVVPRGGIHHIKVRAGINETHQNPLIWIEDIE